MDGQATEYYTRCFIYQMQPAQFPKITHYSYRANHCLLHAYCDLKRQRLP